MNKENAAQFIPLVQALADGKIIQCKQHTGDWYDMGGGVVFNEYPDRYRIKPEPRKSWYRVAEMDACGVIHTFTADEGTPEVVVERDSYFIRWLTDKINFDVTDK